MCGIAGFYSTEGLNDTSIKNLEKMIGVLNHRGPDGKGFYFDKKQGVAMGHARLSIIDLKTGGQPLYGPGKAQVLTTNGEIYDYKRIRSELICEGNQFKTKSDSEIALHLYRKYGLDFVNHLRGEFAIALYDKEKERLILARDRFGIKPIYYCINKNKVFYGSEIKAIICNNEVTPEFSSEAILHQLMHTMVPGTTLFKNINAVKPGHMVIFKKNGNCLDTSESKYWDMNFPHADAHLDVKDENIYKTGVRDELLEAVRHRLEADVPVGCYLSGGIDSCSMLGLASATQQSPVKAFTISFDHSDYDESSIAKEMAEKTGADQEILYLKADDLYGENYVKTLWHSERTFYNTLGVAKYCMSRRVHECGYKVVVTGEGADELFGGYPAFKRDMFIHGLKGLSPEKEKSYRLALDKSNQIFKGAILAEKQSNHISFDELCGFTPSWIQPWINTLKIARPLLNEDINRDIKNYDPIQAIAQSLDKEQINGRHPLDIAQYTWIKTMLECQILNWGGDRVDMANAMESRPAFLDHHVAELARTIPPELRIKGNIEKYILREAMKNILPEVLYKREKFAFMAPPGHTEQKKAQALEDLLNEYANPSAVKDAGIFDEKKIIKFIDDYKNDVDRVSLTRKDALINHILGLQILHRHFISKDFQNS